jgi:uncharacterized membrane protein YkvA (DUF1232 family)
MSGSRVRENRMHGLTGAAGKATAMVSRINAPDGKPAGLTPDHLPLADQPAAYLTGSRRQRNEARAERDRAVSRLAATVADVKRPIVRGAATVDRMTWLAWFLVALGALIVIWAGSVAVLVAVGRRTDARALAGFIPDCLVLMKRLLGDSRVPRRRKLLVAVLIGYLAMPFDLVPDFIPIAGQLDDVIVVALVLRAFVRRGGGELLREHWPGPPQSLGLLLRAARIEA